MSGVTEILSEFIADTTFDDLPDKVIHEVKRNLLDTIGCALGGLATDIGFEALTFARMLGGRPESTILGTGEKTSCILASYANSRMANALDADETFPIPTHFANATMGAGLAIGERNGTSGRELITAYAVGYELASRIGIGMRPPLFIKSNELSGYLPSYTPGVFVVFAALGAASKLLKLKAEKVKQAIGIAGANCPIPVHGKWSESPILPTTKYGDAGWCALSGVASTLLAHIGTTGYSTVLDGNEHFWRVYGIDDCDFEGMVSHLGKEWNILETTYKPWPSCRYTHYPLWLFLKIRKENQLSPDEIDKVTIRMGPIGTAPRFRNPSPVGPISCQFNHPHVIAMGAYGITPGPAWYSFQTMEDQRVIEFRRKVEVQYDPALRKIEVPSGKFSWKLPTSVAVHARGKVFSAFAEYAKGDPWTEETFFTDDELKEKFLIFAASVFQGSEKWYHQMTSVVDVVFNLETLENVSNLFDFLGTRELCT